MRALIEYFLKNRLLVSLAIFMVFIAGIFSFANMQREGIPNIDIMQLFITTIYPGASPTDVELNISIPIEDALQEIDGIEEVSSISRENMSTVVVKLQDDLSDDKAKDVKREVQKAIDRVTDLPAEVTERPTVTEIKAAIFPMVEVALQGADKKILRESARRLQRKMEQLPGVSYITLVGFEKREVRVEVDPRKLLSTETAMNDVSLAIRARNVRMSGGSIGSYANERSVVTIEEFSDPKLVKNVIIRSNFSGNDLRVKDVAKVVDGYEDQSLYVRCNNKASISLCVHKKESADIIRTIDGVMDLLKKERLPPGVNYNLVNDMSYYTRNRLGIATSNSLIGMLLVVLTLVIFMNLRTALWTAFAIPSSLLITMPLFPVLGITINIMSLGGFILVLGMLVDNAIIISEDIERHREEGKTGIEAVTDSVMDIFMPVLTTVTTTVIAFAPLLLIPGIMGKFMRSMPLVVILALIASFIEAVLILPSQLMFKNGNGKKGESVVEAEKKHIVKILQHWYEGSLRFILQRKYQTLILTFLAVVCSVVFAVKFLPFQLVPKSGITEFYIKLYAPRGVPLEKMSDLVRPVEALVQGLPKNELDSFSTRVGYDSNIYWSQRGTHENRAIIYVYLTPMGKRARYAEDILADIKEKIVPEKIGLEQVTYELMSRGPSGGKPVTVRVLSNNDEQRLSAAKELKGYLAKLPGIYGIDDDNKYGKDEVKIEIDYDQLARLGLTVQDVAATLRTAYDGLKVADVRYGDDDVEFKVRLAPKFRKDTSYLFNLPVRNMAGKLVRLKKFAVLSVQRSALDINRFNRLRSLTITSEVDWKKNTAFKATADLRKFADKLGEKYPDVLFSFGGEGRETEKSLQSLKQAFILALIGIYFMLVLLFKDYTQPLFVMSAIPNSIIAIILAFILHREPLTFGAVIGFIGLAGVVVNDSLVMVSFINTQYERLGKDKAQFLEAVVRGAVLRLRPILLTSITTIAGVLPLVYGWGGRDEFMRPPSMVLGYGLLGATFMTLFVVPCLLLVHKDFIERVSKISLGIKTYFVGPRRTI